ncbi:phasin family protein [Paraburkholderia sp. IMGN_8]|uniref:phasin family protein n=1 Tax=Paraburkholderia sp. IMGN_8 TaxID=3136564 RepID=UPI0031017DCE
MSDFQGQASAAQQANLDLCFGVANKILDGGEQLTRLNLDTAKATLSDWYQNLQNGLTKTAEQRLSGFENAVALPSTEKVLSYQHQVAEIAFGMRMQLAEVIDAHYQETSRCFQRFVENVAQNAPVSSEASIAFMKQIITLANTAHDTLHKAAKQTVDIAKSSVSVATEAAKESTESAEQAVEKSAKAVKH